MIALVLPNTLGDGLLYMTLAHNLKQNGYDVVVYSHLISQLSEWFPSQTVLPYPSRSVLDAFDLVIGGELTYFTKNNPAMPQSLAKRYVFMSMARFDQRFVADHSERIRAQFSGEKQKKLLVLARLAGVIVPNLNPKLAMADSVRLLCKDSLGFEKVTKDNGLVAPKRFIFQKYPKRIIIHPESGVSVKSWTAAGFIKLARKLKQKGYTPAFITSPTERGKWQALIGDEFALPESPSVSDAAGYIYESGSMVGNDSGVGHLASNLGIPTFTLLKTKDPLFRYRPGWARNQLILPTCSIKLCGKRYWRRFITVKQILKAMQL